MGRVIAVPFPNHRGEKPSDDDAKQLIMTAAHQNAVEVRIGEIELWLDPDDAREWAMNLMECADDAESR